MHAYADLRGALAAVAKAGARVLDSERSGPAPRTCRYLPGQPWRAVSWRNGFREGAHGPRDKARVAGVAALSVLASAAHARPELTRQQSWMKGSWCIDKDVVKGWLSGRIGPERPLGPPLYGLPSFKILSRTLREHIFHDRTK